MSEGEEQAKLYQRHVCKMHARLKTKANRGGGEAGERKAPQGPQIAIFPDLNKNLVDNASIVSQSIVGKLVGHCWKSCRTLSEILSDIVGNFVLLAPPCSEMPELGPG